MTQRLFITTAKGMEALAARELAGLGAEAITEVRAGVECAGSLELAYRACMYLHTASRVLLPLATFDAADENGIYDGVRAIEWSDHLSVKHTLAVDFATRAGVKAHTQFGAQRTKDAIVDQFRDRAGDRPSVDREAPDVRVNVYFDGAHATVSLDLSGESLHQRGYRPAAGDAAVAPLKESLADALLLHADWPARAKAGVPLYDPMCGSGTLILEAALMALDRAPGLSRERFGFERWLGHDAAAWTRISDEAKQRATLIRQIPELVGSDENLRAVEAAVGSSRVDLQACKLEYSIVSPK